MRLDHIEPSVANAAASPEGVAGRPAEPLFTLVTRAGTRIAWGYAPGANAMGELSAAEKVARLQRYFEKYDMLDGLGGKAQELDVRDMPPAVQP